MAAAAQQSAPVAAPDWIDCTCLRPLRRMQVSVKLESGLITYTREYRSSMDAYEEAFDRYRHALRIEVQPVPYSTANEPGKAALS
ncbi:MAG: hypothetical protein K2W93_08905 [Burkholderiaceae bacterium]|nr:hypothetical protein [Burkholderiaceae bacterium]